MPENKTESVNENQNSTVPSGRVIKDSSLDAAPSFTPGPWLLTRGVGGEWGVDAEKGEWGIAIVAGQCGFHGIDGDAESDANAHLIAAAPALYEALQEFLRMVGYALESRDALLISKTCATWKKAAAALALAEGKIPERETEITTSR
jgi:hypothetical protein